jgi:hypothetical protein
MRSLAGFITIMCGFRFSVHTACEKASTWSVLPTSHGFASLNYAN